MLMISSARASAAFFFVIGRIGFMHVHITAWWGWVILGGGAAVLAVLLWLVYMFLHFLLHFLDGW
jgi:hypothetical protein